MSDNFTSRRDFLKVTAVGTTGMAIGSPVRLFGRKPTEETTSWEIKLGVASYSLRAFSRSEAISMIKELNTPYVNIKSFHLPYESTPEELAAGRREFEEAGLKIVGGGVISLQKDDDDDVRFHFEYAKKSGMPLMVIAPTPQTLPRIEKFVKEYDIKVAIHNHGPEDSYFPAPQDAIKNIETMDPRVGVCVDVGHTTRTGADIVEAIADAGSRVLDIHMKDLQDLIAQGKGCIVGEGAMPVAGIFQQLKKMKYSGYMNLEYEIDKENPLPGMKQSFAYMRGVLAGLNQGA